MTNNKDPFELTFDPSTWTRTLKVGLAFFSALIIVPLLWIVSHADMGKFASEYQRQIASNSKVIALLLSFYLFASNTPGNLFKSIKILFSDFRFDLYVAREIASWVYFVGMVAFFSYFIEGLVLFQWGMVGISVSLFILFRILLELAIAAVATSKNASFVAKK